MEQARRSKRQRVTVGYSHLDTSGFADCIRVQHKKLARAVLKFVGQVQEEEFAVSTVAAPELAAHVHSTGFGNPCVVLASDDAQSILGIRVPEGELTVDRVAELVGRDRRVKTIDVSTQSEAPVHTTNELAEYFASPSPWMPLLNGLSLDLANTKLHDMVSAPSWVRELDLVNKAWPPAESPIPMVNDCCGKMGGAVAEAAVGAGMQLVPVCLTGPGRGREFKIQEIAVQSVDSKDRETVMDQVMKDYPIPLLWIIQCNPEFYCSRGVPFMMGTTGDDREKLVEDVLKAVVYFVISPQMGKQVVAFQGAMAIMAEQF